VEKYSTNGQATDDNVEKCSTNGQATDDDVACVNCMMDT
jgi:hypothetical protein